jgi:integrase/recombinase XerC
MSRLSPQTLTSADQIALLQASADNLRDHLLFSMALGTGLRLGEVVGLNVGDVFLPNGRPRIRIRLRGEITKGGRVGDIFLPDALEEKLSRFRSWKLARMERLDAGAPLFCNQSGDRISKRRVQMAFKAWQTAAGFDRFVSLLRPTP